MATPNKTTKKTTKSPTPAPAAKSAESTEPVDAAIEGVIEANSATVSKIVDNSSQVAKQSIEKVTEVSKQNAKVAQKVKAETTKGYDDIVTFSKANIDAFVTSNEIMTKGVQQIGDTVFKLVQSKFAEGVDFTQKVLACKTPEELFELQQAAVSANYAKSVEETRILAEMSIKLAEEASKPISERVNVTIETLTKPIAA